jgi:hypothetical protein
MIVPDAFDLHAVPQWHQELLDEREMQVAEGTAKYIDWEIANQEILDAVK